MIFFICFLLSLDVTYGLYFELASYERLKFIVDVPKSTRVLGNYTCEIKKLNSDLMKISSPGSCFNVQIYDPTRKIIFSKWYGGTGTFTFESHLSGEHVLVVFPPRDLQFEYDDAIARIHLQLVSGEESLDFQKIKQYEHLSSIETTLRQFIEQVKDIQKEQDYQRYRESVYRSLSEGISISVISFAGAQICLLIIVITLQTKHLKSFFKHEKLI